MYLGFLLGFWFGDFVVYVVIGMFGFVFRFWRWFSGLWFVVLLFCFRLIWLILCFCGLCTFYLGLMSLC